MSDNIFLKYLPIKKNITNRWTFFFGAEKIAKERKQTNICSNIYFTA